VSGSPQPCPAPAAPVVVPADPADAAALAQLIASAFHDLAPSRWLLPDPQARREIFPGYFRIYVEHALAEGVVDTTPAQDGVALWLPTGLRPPAPSPGYDARLLAATSPHTAQFRLFDAVLDRHHPTGTPHHHLAILAVHPARQGQGTGRALLRAHHAVLDEAGMPAYLEAANPRTRRLYLSLGYADHGLPIHLARGPLMHPMWRNPRPQTRPAAPMEAGTR
jgi:ribosomal protein S18 acetylase RimI-like enzyme